MDKVPHRTRSPRQRLTAATQDGQLSEPAPESKPRIPATPKRTRATQDITSAPKQQAEQQSEVPPRLAQDDRAGWLAHWQAHGQPWRTEPEIKKERQQFLTERRGIVPDIAQGIDPFKNVRLSRADIEWLLGTRENGRARVLGEEIGQWTGLDVRGANLRKADLHRLPLSYLCGGLIWSELDQGHVATSKLRMMAQVHLEEADLSEVHLEHAYLNDVCLQGANLWKAHLESAELADAHLEKASLREAHLEGASLAPFWVVRQEDENEQIQQLREEQESEAAHKHNLVEGTKAGYVRLKATSFTQVKRTILTYPFASNPEVIEYEGTHLEGAILREAHLEGANLLGARLEGADLREVHLERADLSEAHLEGVDLTSARLEGVYLLKTHLEGANLQGALLAGKALDAGALQTIRAWARSFPQVLAPADLQGAFFDGATILNGTTLGEAKFGAVSLADVHWSDVNLALIDWATVSMVGEEREARRQNLRTVGREEKIAHFGKAVRANRQLAVVLRGQGLNEHADYYAYRAQVLQRVVLKQQRKHLKHLGSWLLWLIAGYGYRPLRSLLIYFCMLIGFATGYFVATRSLPTQTAPLAWYEAMVLSVSSFHGRGFFQPVQSLGDPVAIIAAIEAVFGLLIEISFIATFTQRFFGR